MEECLTVNAEQARILEAHINPSVVLDTLKRMKKNKSSGLDGFNLKFFFGFMGYCWTLFL